MPHLVPLHRLALVALLFFSVAVPATDRENPAAAPLQASPSAETVPSRQPTLSAQTAQRFIPPDFDGLSSTQEPTEREVMALGQMGAICTPTTPGQVMCCPLPGG